MKLEDFDYNLPDAFIAQEPILPQHNSKMLVCELDGGQVNFLEKNFLDIANMLPNDRVLVFNRSKVMPARVILPRVKAILPTGNEFEIENLEILIINLIDEKHAEGLVRWPKKIKLGTKILFESWEIVIKDFTQEAIFLEFEGLSPTELMEKMGELPLPPYIKSDSEKQKRYQPTISEKPGSVAAPTASLHFTKELLEEIKKRQIQTEALILHVGIGTFRPIDQNENLETHQLHHEYGEISLDLLEKIAKHKIEGKTIIAVGTTSCRSLESLPYLRKSLPQDIKKKYSDKIQARRENLVKNLDSQPPRGKVEASKINENAIFFSSSLFILPGYNFNIVDELITNFHLPKSSLLMLVSAFTGIENLHKIYNFAIENKYRFYSFGDGMWIKMKQ